jgi:NAD(P)-dependent dehydrogenase (short-subunit alcohol dehydrogenase family)
MQLTQDLSGRHAVVTGGAAGLGRAIASLLSAAGAAITVVDLPAALDAATLPGDWRVRPLDLAGADALDALRRFGEEAGSIDIAVANAGVVPPWRGVEDLDGAEWQRVMAINTWGVAATLGGLAPALARSGRGAVVVMASINGYRAHGKQVLYTASKHAAIGIMRAAALDLGAQGIRVNALAPGPVATDALRQRIADRHAAGGPPSAEALAALAADTALGRIATEEDVARAALFLASEASAGISGVVLPVEAGLA